MRLSNFDRAVLAQRRLPGAGSYVTDGRDLFYVLRTSRPQDRDCFTELENCRTLDVLVVSRDELERMRLWPVRFACESVNDFATDQAGNKSKPVKVRVRAVAR